MTTPPITPGQPPYAYPAQQPYPVAPPRRGLSPRMGIALTLAGLAVFIGGFWVVEAVGKAVGGNHPPAAADKSPDFHVTGCTAEYGFYHATISARNNSARTQSYTLVVEWVDSSGTRLARDTEYFTQLRAGQSAIQEAIGVGADRTDQVACHISTG